MRNEERCSSWCHAYSRDSPYPNRRTAATRSWPTPNGIPIDQGERVCVALPAAKQKSPAARYQTPTANICRGRNRHDANTPKLKISSHRPGNIQHTWEATLMMTTVNRNPTTTEGRNWETADWTISLASPTWTRRARAKVPVPVRSPATAAVAAHAASHVVGSGFDVFAIHCACNAATRNARIPLTAIDAGP